MRLLLELYCVIVSKQLPSYYLCEIYNGIHLYQFTFELLLFFFLVVVAVSDLNKKIVAALRI